MRTLAGMSGAAVSSSVLALTGCMGDDDTPTIETRFPEQAWLENWARSRTGDERAGAMVFAEVGCFQCHTHGGTGSQNVGAPDLTSIGAPRGKDADYFARYVADPRQFGNTVMPTYEGLGPEKLRQLGAFLESSKGDM